MIEQDTICAISTPAGSGGVGIVRISGSGSLQILNKVFIRAAGTNYSPGRMYFGTVKVGVTDNALAVYFRAPKSFTGEDVCEIHCHGSPVLLQELVKKLIGHGARHAEAGEFTKRAFINGKLDLTESEGLIDIINAESTAALTAATALHRGQLSKKIRELQQELKLMLAHIEVTIDYSEEGIEEVTFAHVQQGLQRLSSQLLALKNSFSEGRLMREGISIAICGKPNAGKSSLLNAIIGYERAIVTDVPGTTRDSIDAEYIYNGMRYKLTDTAGLRESVDTVEKLGIQRARDVILQSDAVIYVDERPDALKDFLKGGTSSQTFLQVKQISGGKPLFAVLSKLDTLTASGISAADIISEIADIISVKVLTADKISEAALNTEAADSISETVLNTEAGVQGIAGAIAVSSVTGENIDKFKAMLHKILAPKINAGGAVLTNSRHYDAVSRAYSHASDALAEVGIAYLDMTAYSLMQIYNILGEITGDNSVESIIDEIFSRFCVGK